jgi:ATP-dependent DNA helicase RecG
MAPTEILADQHFKTIRRVLSAVGQEEGEGNIFTYSGFLQKSLSVVLLMGDISHKKKRKIQGKIACGEVDIIIGTHTLIQKDVAFFRLGLVIVDEQHRFGVEQRSMLRQRALIPCSGNDCNSIPRNCFNALWRPGPVNN